MNTPSIAIDSAVFSGELKRTLIAFGIVMLVVLIAWAIQTFREGR